MAKRDDLNKLMKSRFDEAMQSLDAARERNSNTFTRNTADNDVAAQASNNQPDEGKWSIDMPNDVKDVGTEVYTAPTANPKRPRAYTVGYNHNTKTLVIVMRSGAWWQYNDIPVNIWLGLKNSSSTNAYLPIIENSCSSHHAANVDALSEGTKARFSQTAAMASRIQAGNLPTWEDMFTQPKE